MAQAALQRLVPDAPAALCDILSGARGPVEPPIRSEIFGQQRFAQHGRSLAESHRAARATSNADLFFPRLRSNLLALREACTYIGVQASSGYDISPAAEWLLDNFHLIEAQLKEIHEGLPRSYFRALPVLLDEPLRGLPRVYSIAWAFVAHTDGAFDEELLIRFLCAYQERHELNLSEIWALPTTLRVVLVENLRRLAERVATNKAAREVANLCCDRIESYTLSTLEQLLALLERRGVGRAFLAQMAQRLQTDSATGPAEIDQWLQQALPEPALAQTQRNADQAADNLSVSNAINSLRGLGDADWPDIVNRTSALMRLMLGAPLFEAEHSLTRDQTLHGVELLAQRCDRSETSVAQTLLDLMRGTRQEEHATAGASHWLAGAGRGELLRALDLHERFAFVWRAIARRTALPVYLGSLLLGSLGLVAWILLHHAGTLPAQAAPLALTLLTAALMVFPASEAVVAVINRLISESARPRALPRLALGNGIPPEHRVMVVVPAMLSDLRSIAALVHRLELHYLANPEPNAQFALLSDWNDADSAQVAADATLLDSARRQIEALNLRYPRPDDPAARFILLHRRRAFCQTERRWIGWERKRGKLELLVAALAQGSAGAFVDLGPVSRMGADIKYLVTLDSDTGLPPGRLRELVGVAAHPDNQPRLDASGRVLQSGYGILQPRVVTPLPAPKDFTLYHWLFAGQCGIDPYSAATSEVYQDLFHEGTFTGKGLLNVRAMHALLGQLLPEGKVLSHDLLEGSIARCATVTDIAIVEDAPFHADVAMSRVHRWTRGDWQLLPFLFQPARYRLRAINRWKMFDNLRRSLVAPMSLALVLLSLATPGISPWAAMALVLAAFSAGPLMGAAAGFSTDRDDLAKFHFYRLAATDLLRALCGGLWLWLQLLQHSMMALDAIVRALYRMAVSKRHLLQWTTAAAAQLAAKSGLAALARAHWQEPALALLLLGALAAVHTPYPALSVLVCVLWGAAPVWTWWVSRERAVRADAALPEPEQDYLQGAARDTWRLFERCVGPQDNHLPPDNLQVLPHDIVAHRTSPTNIGLYLLSVACARAFGWIGTEELLARMEATLATLERLQRHRGHFLNWYDTQSCTALLPMYVSTVDSGNLSGHLLAVAQACLELAAAPHDPRAAQQAAARARQRLAVLLPRRKTLAPADRAELRLRLADHRATRRSARLDAHCAAQSAPAGSAQTAQRLQTLAAACEKLAWAADFRFLYHRKRNLLHIGYRVAEQQLDASFYDLLASESRLTSLLAIAKGDVPVRHWACLGRPFYAVGAHSGLRSWSGSMFEYLMPSLVLDEPYGSALHAACDTALREQIAFGQAHGVPWGLSESAYAASDYTLAYQYAPQGVPRLALRRTPPDELVVAPYATALAAQIAPRRARRNFAALEQLGARGRYGFIEALDFSPSRQTGAESVTPVGTFMAHHQGMSIVALANVLLGAPAQRWGMANAHIEAVASLLHERAPRAVSMLHAPPAGPPPQTMQRRTPGQLREVVPGEAALEPTHLLSNGRYHVTLRANGAGWSRWGQTGITRWRDDALRDLHGSFFYLRWDRWPRPVSITQHPAPDPTAHYQSVFHADRMCFDTTWPELQTHTEVWVSPEDDIEFRRVELRNLGDRTVDIELLSAFEVTLADPRADEAHPAFGNLFVRAHWQEEDQALVFERRPRLPTEQGLRAAHFLTDGDPQIVAVRVQTDRQRWLGRNHEPGQPLATFDAAGADAGALDGDLDTGLDPVCAVAVRLRIAPNGKARLTFATAASDSNDTLQAVIDKYRQSSHVARASLMSATLTSIRLRALHISADKLAAVQALSSALTQSLTRVQVRATQRAGAPAEVCDKRLIWRFGISGDRPLILVSVAAPEAVGLLRSMAQALQLWSWGGIACDLVVVNAEPASYLMPLQREIAALVERHRAQSAAHSNPEGTGFHMLRADDISVNEMSTLRILARVRFNADGRPLRLHVQEWLALHEKAFEDRHGTSTMVVSTTSDIGARDQAPVGAFDATSGEFRFDVSARLRPLRPWINVLANPDFGAQISETGGGYTWALNSRLMQLTAWSNDPVTDQPSEWFLLQDRKTMDVWSVAPSAWGDEHLSYQVSHGQGCSTINHRRADLEVSVSWCVDPQSSVKQVRVRLFNRGHKTLHLRVIGIAEWIMGANRTERRSADSAVHHTRVPGPDGAAPDSGQVSARALTTLLCTQRERSTGFGDGTAFLAVAGAADEHADWTCDRRECFDACGRLVLPDHFGQRSGAGLDPCAALSSRVELGVGEELERVFLLGYAGSPQAARELAASAMATGASQREQQVREHWDGLLGAVTVQTPDPLFDALVNRWLLYQAVSCRMWAKAGFYQAGGATGFRDQLQDAMALAWAAPQLLREQIVLCASRQFPQGDVQHWWHAPGGAGVRTHFSDDLLWLPYATAHYLRATADGALLDQEVPFIEGRGIADGAEDAYYAPEVSLQRASVYEHGARAIDRSLAVGVHGLPLMGSGDWNDGMNRVGVEGRGESVWLGWFLCRLVTEFAPIARQRGEEPRALRWESAARGWREALVGPAWDGQWFKRAFFDDGQALGSQANPEARIDLIAQAWSVLSGVAPPALQRMAMAAVETHLVDHRAGLIRLLDPPLADAVPSAGYIQAYPPGVRENGGQYSHAGVWALMAQAELGRNAHAAADGDAGADLAYRYFTWLSPAHRTIDPVQRAAYGIEPYVMAGDVYSHAPYVGRGGWSWYTGAAAWMHRAAIESIFGLRQEARSLWFAPCLPSHWQRAELRLVRGASQMHFILYRDTAVAALQATAQSGAQLLLPGQGLDWSGLSGPTCFVIPLLERPTPGAPMAPPSASEPTIADPLKDPKATSKLRGAASAL